MTTENRSMQQRLHKTTKYIVAKTYGAKYIRTLLNTIIYMFKTLTQNLTKIFDKLVSSGILTEAQIDAAMRDIRVALLESDVALPVIKDFIAEVKQKALGQEVIKSVSPGQMIIKIIHEEMINLLASSESETKLNLNSKPPVNFLMVGLQGSGKTTASSKLALRLKNQNKKSFTCFFGYLQTGRTRATCYTCKLSTD
ncbi:signal recognition particle receptor subunit alpha [Rickettsia felis]|uniref:signal recognition particle receptor subunit alpha n=1 Tax=Rickettsia felis TaxID=42862 RepID=UPI001EEE564D